MKIDQRWAEDEMQVSEVRDSEMDNLFLLVAEDHNRLRGQPPNRLYGQDLRNHVRETKKTVLSVS